jgi:DNA-binding CsgD family transcriptional regulator
MAMFLGSHEAARAYLAESCELYRAGGDLHGLALALREACAAAFAQRDLAAAQQLGEESIALLRAVGSPGDLAMAIDNLGATFAAAGKHAAARAAFEEEHAICIAHGYRSSLALATMGLGWVAGLQGDYAAAAAHLDKAVALQRQREESWTLAQALHLSGQVAQRSGDLLHAGRCYRESLLLADQIGDKAAVAAVLRQLAALAHAQGQYEDSVRLLAAAEAHHPAGCAINYTLDNPAERSQLAAAARTTLGEELFATCWAQGQTVAPQQALVLAVGAGGAGEAAPSISGPYRRSMPLPGNPDHLTAREVEVLQLLVHGLTYADIADRLVIRPRTVNAHLTAIYSKFDVNSRQEAVRFAIKHRLLPAPGRTPAGTG